MTRLERYANLVAVIVPFIAFLGAIALLWNSYVGWTDLAILATMYLATAIGVTVGYHRLFTHRAFDAVAPVRYTLAVLGSMAVQGPVIDWVADHRKHHAFADDDGDPHSPHGHGSGLRGAMKGLYYAHMGWLSVTQGQAEKRRFAADLLEDPVLRKIRYDTGAMVGWCNPFMERYVGLLQGLMENPADETPGWHASELETSQMLANDERLANPIAATTATGSPARFVERRPFPALRQLQSRRDPDHEPGDQRGNEREA